MLTFSTFFALTAYPKVTCQNLSTAPILVQIEFEREHCLTVVALGDSGEKQKHNALIQDDMYRPLKLEVTN